MLMTALVTASACAASTSTVQAQIPGVSAKEIVIGATHPMTGPVASAGLAQHAGVQLAVDEINAKGGVNGHLFKFIGYDDAFDPTRSVANVRRLIDEDKVYALVAPSGGSQLPASWPFIQQRGTIIWGPITPPDPKLPSVFLLAPSRQLQDQVIIDYFADKLGVKKLAVISQPNDIGAGAEKAAQAQVSKHPGMSLVATEHVDAGNTDVSSQVINVKNSGADGLIIGADNAQTALILQQMAKLGLKIPVGEDNGGAGTGGMAAVKAAGASAEGFYGGMNFQLPSSTGPLVSNWKSLAQAAGGADALSPFSMQMYSETVAFFELMKRLNGDYSYKNFQKVAEQLVTKPIVLDTQPAIACGPLPAGHSCASGGAIAQYKGGKWTVVQDFVNPK
jgi:branched-chain amino acid transport system substrate-binding protein